MISPATRRTVLRVFHLLLSIPVLGYIYGPPAEMQEYASTVRWVFIPVIILSGFWMYAGLIFAIVGVALWLAAYYFVGVGTALIAEMALFVARGLWLLLRRRKRSSLTTNT